MRENTKKQDFVLKVEKEAAISALNRFVHRRFGRSTNVWSDAAGHNILLFVLAGSAECFMHGSSVSQRLDGKVIVLPRGSAFVLEFSSSAEVLTYSFDGYLPMDMGLLGKTKDSVDEGVALNIRPRLRVELAYLYDNLSLILNNEAFTLISIRKVIDAMQRCYSAAEMAIIFSVFAQSDSRNCCRYARILENYENLTTKSCCVKF